VPCSDGIWRASCSGPSLQCVCSFLPLRLEGGVACSHLPAGRACAGARARPLERPPEPLQGCPGAAPAARSTSSGSGIRSNRSTSSHPARLLLRRRKGAAAGAASGRLRSGRGGPSTRTELVVEEVDNQHHSTLQQVHDTLMTAPWAGRGSMVQAPLCPSVQQLWALPSTGVQGGQPALTAAVVFLR
jgi:hypothetical protein